MEHRYQSEIEALEDKWKNEDRQLEAEYRCERKEIELSISAQPATGKVERMRLSCALIQLRKDKLKKENQLFMRSGGERQKFRRLWVEEKRRFRDRLEY